MQRVERERQLEVAGAHADDITDSVADVDADVIPDIAADADAHTNADAVLVCQVENYSIRLQAAEREGKGLGDEVKSFSYQTYQFEADKLCCC